MTDQTMECMVTEWSNEEYEHPYEQTVGVAYQLHVKVEGEDVDRSTFPLTVRPLLSNLEPSSIECGIIQ